MAVSSVLTKKEKELLSAILLYKILDCGTAQTARQLIKMSDLQSEEHSGY